MPPSKNACAEQGYVQADRVEANLTTEKVVLKEVGPVCVAELTATAESYSRQDIEPALRRLYPELSRRLTADGVRRAAGPAIAYYEDPAEPSDTVIVHAALPVTARPRRGCGFRLVSLPPIRSAATLIHRGTTGDVIQSLLIVAGWIEDHGYRPVGYHRELYFGHQPGDAGSGAIELQATVVTRRNDRGRRLLMPVRAHSAGLAKTSRAVQRQRVALKQEMPRSGGWLQIR